jgi:hypothetical protein
MVGTQLVEVRPVLQTFLTLYTNTVDIASNIKHVNINVINIISRIVIIYGNISLRNLNTNCTHVHAPLSFVYPHL